mmetsp:Transcript_12656/g.54197  ORF Transcript_12656/g.54197 Transcript_12656/m.54197 type:complete len:303 (+) Transcript_12656:993-1901(+)
MRVRFVPVARREQRPAVALEDGGARRGRRRGLGPRATAVTAARVRRGRGGGGGCGAEQGQEGQIRRDLRRRDDGAPSARRASERGGSAAAPVLLRGPRGGGGDGREAADGRQGEARGRVLRGALRQFRRRGGGDARGDGRGGVVGAPRRDGSRKRARGHARPGEAHLQAAGPDHEAEHDHHASARDGRSNGGDREGAEDPGTHEDRVTRAVALVFLLAGGGEDHDGESRDGDARARRVCGRGAPAAGGLHAEHLRQEGCLRGRRRSGLRAGLHPGRPETEQDEDGDGRRRRRRRRRACVSGV